MTKKTSFLYVAGLILVFWGSWTALMESEIVFNKSYMMTLDALGKPGVTQQHWSYFIGAVGAVILGIVLLVVGYRKQKTSK